MPEKKNLRDIIAAEFVKALSEDQLPWNAMWSTGRPYNATNNKTYRGLNSLWLSYVASAKGYTDPRWCTFKQAEDNNWYVKKGEKGTKVEFWSIYDKKQRKNISMLEANDIVKKDPDREKDMRMVSRTYTVFNAQQIEGIPELDRSNVVVDVAAIRAQRDVLLKNMGLEFHEGGNRAFYSPSMDSITMPPDVDFENDYAYMSTFLHECGHATGHPSRLDRDLSGIFGSESYAKEELRAEIASAFTAQALGFGADDTTLSFAMDNHKAYIQSWISAIRHKPPELFAAIKDAEKISDYLIEKGEFKLPEFPHELKESLDDKIESAEVQRTNTNITGPEHIPEMDL